MLQDTGSGLPNIWLTNGYERHETKWGSGTSIFDPDGLSRAITNELCLSEHKLTGADFRFLRKRIGLTQDELGAELGCTGQAIAKWEKGEIHNLPSAPARLLRLLVLSKLFPEIPVSVAVADYKAPSPEKILFNYNDECGWQCSEHTHPEISSKSTRKESFSFHEAFPYFGQGITPITAMNSFFAVNDQEFVQHASKFVTA